MALTLDEANKIVAGAGAQTQEKNIKISVGVWDAGGGLVAFNRMGGAIWGGIGVLHGVAGHMLEQLLTARCQRPPPSLVQ